MWSNERMKVPTKFITALSEEEHSKLRADNKEIDLVYCVN
jgi:hypothetical protein